MIAEVRIHRRGSCDSIFFNENGIFFNVANSSSFGRMIDKSVEFAKQSLLQKYSINFLYHWEGVSLASSLRGIEWPFRFVTLGQTEKRVRRMHLKWNQSGQYWKPMAIGLEPLNDVIYVDWKEPRKSTLGIASMSDQRGEPKTDQWSQLVVLFLFSTPSYSTLHIGR